MLQDADLASDRLELLSISVHLLTQSVLLVQLVRDGYLCQIVLVPLGPLQSIVLQLGRVHGHLLLLVVVIVRQRHSALLLGLRLEARHVRSHRADRSEPVPEGDLQLALDAGLRVEAFGRVLERAGVNVNGRLGSLAGLAQGQVYRG